MSTKSQCNKIRRITGCRHSQAARLLQMFGQDIVNRTREDNVPWFDAAKSVLTEVGEVFTDESKGKT